MRTHPDHGHGPRSVLLSFQFTGTAMVGSLTMALVSAFAPLPAQVAVLGALISILAGLIVRSLEQEEERDHLRNAVLDELKLPLALAPDHDLFDQYAAFSRALGRLSRQGDPVLRGLKEDRPPVSCSLFTRRPRSLRRCAPSPT